MRLVKPNWVTHDGSPIFSVDIHPDGKRFATGGQGGDSGRVVIWNMEPVVNEEAEANEKIPKLLCQMDHHLACVNCVRWSSSGVLASGGDDKLIMIWRLAPGVGVSTLFGSKAGVETWRCKTTLRAHQGDILDLAWSPHNPWLASSSVDNTVIVWDVPNATIKAVLKGHTGLVKGVTWDPIGKYLASQSDDKSLRVWRTSDWAQETVITEPFEESGNTTHILRLSWSPDGQYLVSAHAMNGGGPTAQIIEREGWKTDKDFVGHRKAVTCVRFNGNMFVKKALKGNRPVNYCCAAIGSRDRSLSVWSTSLQRPLVVIHELFMSSVLDVSWSTCGMRLCACSKDGTVVFVEFTSDEIGQPVNADQLMQIQEHLYGKISNRGCVVVEDPDLLAVEPIPPPPSTSVPEPSPTETEEAYIESLHDSIYLTNSVTISAVKAPTYKQIETRTSDGKRRITPMFIPAPSDPMDSGPSGSDKPVPTPASFSSSSQTKSTIVIEKRNEVVQPNISSNAAAGAASSPAQETPGLESLPLKRKETSSQKPNASPKKPKVAMEKNGCTVLLPPLKPNSNLYQLCGHFSVSVKVEKSLYHLQVFKGRNNDMLWDHYLGYCAVGLALTPTVLAVALEDGSVHTFHTSRGARATPPLIPPSPIARIHAAGSMVMVVSSYGDVLVWEISSFSCRLTVSTSAAHLIAPGQALYTCSIYNGMPYLVFTHARAYLYHPEMGAWLLIGDSQDPMWRWSAMSFINGMDVGTKIPKGPLANLQEGLNRTAGNPIPLLATPNGASTVLTYLEQQVLVSRALKSSEEYTHWLLALVKYMCVHESFESRLRVILDDLLGPSHSTAHLSNWDPLVLGVKKHKLLEDVLKILSHQLQWQRLYLEYNEQYQELKQL